MKISGHKVLVTGATRGIGKAIAKALVEAGNRVIVTGRDAQRAREVAAEIGAIRFYGADLLNAGDIARLSRAIEDDIGEISLLVNNAGIQLRYDLASEAAAPDLFAHEITANLLAPMQLTHQLIPLMRETKGEKAIVNVTSALALVPKEASPSYCASKAAFRSYTQVLRWHLERDQIKVFELLPPRVDTDMTAGSGGDKLDPKFVAQSLLDGMAEDSEEIMPGPTAQLWAMYRNSPREAAEAVRRM